MVPKLMVLPPHRAASAKTENISLIMKVQARVGVAAAYLKAYVCFSASSPISPNPFFHVETLLFLQICWGFREGRDAALLPPPSRRCGLQEPPPPPVIILSSRDRVMAPGRGLFHQSSQLLMSFMLLLHPQLPSQSPPPRLLSHLPLAAADCWECVWVCVYVCGGGTRPSSEDMSLDPLCVHWE